MRTGLLFRNERHTENKIEHLQHSLSSTRLLAGCLAFQHHDNTVSSHIVCNNAGALFVHAVAHNTTVADILQPKYVPPIVRSFFQLNGVKNHEGTSQPLLAVQVTELVDAVFINIVINRVVADGKSFWHFVNSWAEISRGGHTKIFKPPNLQRYFLDGIEHPILFPFSKEEHSQNLNPQIPPKRVFQFTKEKIAELKLKANAEANTNRISSLQVVLTLLWRSVIRCQHVQPQEELTYVLITGVRARMVPPLAENYFGNAILAGRVTMKAEELLQGGLGKIAFEMNKMISLHYHENIKKQYESWVRTPTMVSPSVNAVNYSLITTSSPRFDIYGSDFGWGKPVAVRSGSASNASGKITVFAASEEGSIDIQVCLPYEILEAMGNDPEFVDAISY